MYEKSGILKIASGMVLCLLLVSIWKLTGYQHDILWKLAMIPGGYVISFIGISIIYAWIINPITMFIEKRKTKKE